MSINKIVGRPGKELIYDWFYVAHSLSSFTGKLELGFVDRALANELLALAEVFAVTF